MSNKGLQSSSSSSVRLLGLPGKLLLTPVQNAPFQSSILRTNKLKKKSKKQNKPTCADGNSQKDRARVQRETENLEANVDGFCRTFEQPLTVRCHGLLRRPKSTPHLDKPIPRTAQPKLQMAMLCNCAHGDCHSENAHGTHKALDALMEICENLDGAESEVRNLETSLCDATGSTLKYGQKLGSGKIQVTVDENVIHAVQHLHRQFEKLHLQCTHLQKRGQEFFSEKSACQKSSKCSPKDDLQQNNFF